jgi:hypothetical protein
VPQLTIVVDKEDEATWKSNNVATAGMMDANYNFPDNVAVVTLQLLLLPVTSDL